MPSASGHRRKRSPRTQAPMSFHVCEALTAALIYTGLVFGPWALGTTEPWSTWIMNWIGYTLGGLLLAKKLICWLTAYAPEKWNVSRKSSGDGLRKSFLPRALTATLLGLNILILLYCLVSALNARATYVFEERRQVFYDQFYSFLPHSYDSRATWYAFWQYLGLSLFFWSARDWLLTQSRRERQGEDQSRDKVKGGSARQMPDRLKRLLWVLCLNGAILGIEGLLQRFSGTDKLLWLVQPVFNRDGIAQFGPYSYRSNAAAYFNLLWPVCLGFWWCLRKERHMSRHSGETLSHEASFLLRPCTVIMAVCPLVSMSRGGAMVAAGQMVLALVLLLAGAKRILWRQVLGMAAIFMAALVLVTGYGWDPLMARLKTMDQDKMSGRMEIYQNCQQMLEDFPMFGSGPGTFCSVYQYYRERTTQEWMAQAHDDWLETRTTFGWVGFSLVLAALLVVLPHWSWGAGMPIPRTLVMMLWLGLVGCLVHARFDFPLQIHSILTLFLLLCVILSCSSRRC